MTAYYNEIDPYAAQWLRNLIAAGHIAPGDVDERSISDVRPSDLAGYTQCHFFAGIGVWSYALRQAGWPDDRPVWTGSCPCQPFSEGGARKGFADERHLWPHWHHLITFAGPPIVFGEQVASKVGYGWLDLVQADLEAVGYSCGATVLPAAGIGAPHGRHRTWFVAHTDDAQRWTEESARNDADRAQAERDQSHRNAWKRLHSADWLTAARQFSSDAHGAASRMGQLRAYGNAIVAEVAQAVIASYLDARRDRSAPVGSDCGVDEFESLLS